MEHVYESLPKTAALLGGGDSSQPAALPLETAGMMNIVTRQLRAPSLGVVAVVCGLLMFASAFVVLRWAWTASLAIATACAACAALALLRIRRQD